MRLGYPHPDYLLKALTAKQLMEWEAFNLIQPIGDRRQDILFASLNSLLMNIQISKSSKKGSNPKYHSITDYLIDWGNRKIKEVKKQSTNQMKNFLLSFAKKHNEKVKQKKETHPPIKRRK